MFIFKNSLNDDNGALRYANAPYKIKYEQEIFVNLLTYKLNQILIGGKLIYVSSK